MFTGIIEAVGKVAASTPMNGDRRFEFTTGKLDLSDVKLGDSICVSGVCLTAIAINDSGFSADVSSETLTRTALGELGIGSAVNLEKSLTPTTRLGGHLVSGHVDGVGQVTQFYQDARSWRLHIDAPAPLGRYIAEKGSVCIDGVSLTVNGVTDVQDAVTGFDLNIIPHTLQETIIGDYRPGRRVNLEVDIIARYLERLLLADPATAAGGGRVTEQLLRASGFIKHP